MTPLPTSVVYGRIPAPGRQSGVSTLRRCNMKKFLVAGLPLFLSTVCFAQMARSAPDQATSPDWTETFPPFHIAGNLYYVGSKGLANYLITTPQGNILINSDLEANVPM